MSSASSTRPIVIFRAAKGPDDPYGVIYLPLVSRQKALSKAGYCPHFVPVLQFEFLNATELSTALLDPSPFAGLIFTSQTAVDSASHALMQTSDRWQERVVEKWKHLPVFAVGKATAQAVEGLGLEAVGTVSGNADALSDVILQHFSSHDKSALNPLLFPCGNLRRDTLAIKLSQGGLQLHTLVSYRTVPDPHIAERLRTLRGGEGGGLLLDEAPCWVVFFSPSGVQFALEHLKAICSIERLKFAAIGPTTAEALIKAGAPPSAVSSKPSPKALVEAIS